MNEHSIIFQGDSIRAILDGRKTQTRRIIRPQPPEGHWWAETPAEMALAAQYYPGERGRKGCPYGVPGDRLWCRESIRKSQCEGEYGPYIEYVADGEVLPMSNWIWKRNVLPSIHMPRGCSRLTLEVARVRVQRVQDITEVDAKAEGCEPNHIRRPGYAAMYDADYRDGFRLLWNRINAKRGYGWDASPWVWAIDFRPLPVAVRDA